MVVLAKGKVPKVLEDAAAGDCGDRKLVSPARYEDWWGRVGRGGGKRDGSAGMPGVGMRGERAGVCTMATNCPYRGRRRPLRGELKGAFPIG